MQLQCGEEQAPGIIKHPGVSVAYEDEGGAFKASDSASA